MDEPTEIRTSLTREAILTASDIRTEWVDVPEWGGGVYVKGLTGKQRDDYEISMIHGKGKNRDVNLANARAKLIYLSTMDSSGKKIFQPEDIPTLGSKGAAAMQRVFDVAQRLSGLTDEDVEELVTELGEDQSAALGSA